ncbi:helix-turn-helix domain-containing protein [Streptomyces sp. ME02-7008A-1]|nr:MULTISPECIES: helix-turn-helix domain-containing protein [unclassified Streptomyces]MDX3186198.1 helix-turn-helix domain-containing protein [Streptomyces sp. ME02-7008A-1]MDX3307064.1 helix-turn-helix domain-containing protein [Streptomyces sp. ME02-7008A]
MSGGYCWTAGSARSVTAIARHLGIGRSTVHRTLSAYDEAIATSRVKSL